MFILTILLRKRRTEVRKKDSAPARKIRLNCLSAPGPGQRRFLFRAYGASNYLAHIFLIIVGNSLGGFVRGN